MPSIPHRRSNASLLLALTLSLFSLAVSLLLPTRAANLLWPSAHAANTFTVTNTNDSGPGSLRQAITDANANPGLDTINFSIGSGVQTIKVLSNLPAISDPAIIDGTTQPGFVGQPIIELKGKADSGTYVGLHLSAGNSTVRGLVINSFLNAQIFLGGGGNRVEGNYIGPDVTGTARVDGFVGYGIGVSSSNNIIGGTVSGAGNLISGNFGSGIEMMSDLYSDPTTGNVVQGNLIGTNAAGTAALGNSENGVHLLGVCQNNTIGGAVPGAGNVISGNSGSGVLIEGDQNTGNVVQGNLIGTNAAGTAPLPNGYHGIQIGGAPGTIIGGTTTAARNVVSGNDGAGISLGSYSDGASSGSTVQGNFIGTGADGRTPIPNGLRIFTTGGIYIWGSNNTIGGTANGAGNLIAFNGQAIFDDQAGVQVASGTGNKIRGNSLFSNAGLGIELVPYGVTANDSNDTDTGVNNRQNFPLITSVTPDSNSTTIQGMLNSTPNTSFAIDFYASGSCNPSGNGEGASYIGSSNVATAGSGNASFNVTLPVALPAGRTLTATATDPAGNTSEFSPCSTGATTGHVQFSALNLSASEGVGTAIVTVTRTGGSTGTIVVNYATSQGTATVGEDYTAVSGTLTFADGETSKTIGIPFINDSVDENNETIILTLIGAAAGETVGNPSRTTLSITDNDPTPILSMTPLTVVEGNTGTTNAVFTMSLSAVSGRRVTVNYETFDATAQAGKDYQYAGGQLVFNPGVTTQTITVPIIGDTVPEPDETFYFYLFSASGVNITNLDGTVTITNDDVTTNLQFSAASYNRGEGDGSASVTVTRLGDTSGEVSVTFATGDGTASNGSDYTAVSQTVTFAAGDATDKTIVIPINNDAEFEGTETVNLTLTNPTGGAVLGATNTAVLNINDDDPVPTALVVNTTNDMDDGVCNALHCSLREAINTANNSPGANTISFNIPGAGVKTITPATQLPQITEQVTIDGYTQPGAHPNTLVTGGDDAVLLIELDGSSLPVQFEYGGLDIAASNCTLRGLVINRFKFFGIYLHQYSDGNVIEGNFIGTDASGSVALGNLNGVLIGEATNNTVGGRTPAARNLISGNLRTGLGLTGYSSGNKVQGNFIGTKANGAEALGNGDLNANYVSAGIQIISSPGDINNTIGGTESGAANIIAFNNGHGVYIDGTGENVDGNAVLSNSIFANSNSRGIELGSNGVRENDPGDTDSGPNNYQNFPVLTSAVIEGGSTVIQGTLNSTASKEFRLEFFANLACDDSGKGEGQTFIGSKMVTTDSAGDASFTYTPASMVAAGQFITATATDPNNNTSEFSLCKIVAAPQGTLQFSSAVYTVDEGGSTATIEVSRTGGSNGAVSVQYATANGTAQAETDYTTTSGTLSFADGQTSNSFTIPILEDSLDEADETVTLSLTNATGGTELGSPSTAALTITDNDQQPGLSISDVTFAGANSRVAATPEFVVTLSDASGQIVTVHYATADGTAKAGSDYTAASGTLTFMPGETTKSIPITIIGDNLVESDETFFVNLTNAANASITDAQGGGTIPNDDHTYTISGRVLVGTTALGGVTVKLTGSGTVTKTTDAQGNYTFAGLAAGGNYTVTATKTNYTFTPVSRVYTNLNVDKPAQNFAARLQAFTISGRVTVGTAGLSGVTLTLKSPTPAGFTPQTRTTSSTGGFSFANLPAGRTYIVTATKTNYSFTPASRTYSNLNASQTTANFAATLKTYSISGRVTKTGTTTAISAVTMTITSPTPAGFTPRTVQTSSAGNYTFTNLPAGRNYTLKPTKTGYTFTPATRSFTNLSANVPVGSTTGFTGTPTSGP